MVKGKRGLQDRQGPGNLSELSKLLFLMVHRFSCAEQLGPFHYLDWTAPD